MLSLKTLHTLIADVDPSSGDKLYALVDQSGTPNMVRQLERFGHAWTSLLENSREQGAIRVAPILFELDGQAANSASVMRWLCSETIYASSLIFLRSPLLRGELAHRLSHRLDAVLPQEYPIMLRFFDPRVLESLVSVLTEEQSSILLSVARCWWYVSRTGEVRNISCCFADHDVFRDPLKLNQLKKDKLLDASIPDQVGALLLENAPLDFQSLKPSERHVFLADATLDARNYDICEIYDLALYCILKLRNGKNFDTGPPWVELLKKVKMGEMSLTDAAQRYEENYQNSCERV